MSHPDEGLIHAWLDGELDAAEAARVDALVASDAAWAAAAAEARGLVAASARIVGALDRVPAHVIPRASAAPRHPARRWMLRAAAAVVLIGGWAVVLNRTSFDSVNVGVALKEQAPAPAALQAAPPAAPADIGAKKANPHVPGNAPRTDSKSTVVKKELDESKQKVALRDKDLNAPAAESRTESRADAARAPAAGGAAAAAPSPGGARRGVGAATPPVPLTQGALPSQDFAAQKTTRLLALCFAQREPRDSAARIIRLDPGALSDSIRLEKLTLRGDTLAAVNGRLRAVRAPCPAP